jgi:hypothetical protein
MSLEYRNLAAEAKEAKKKKPDVYRYKKYDDGRTKQAFKDQCDINKIIKKHQINNAASHAVQYPPEAYAEFEGVDLLGAYEQIGRANEIFDALPSEVRSEFDNNALKFAAYASDPANINRLPELIPAIARPGAYFPNPVKRGGVGAGAATAPVEPPVSAPTPDPESPPSE